MTEGKKLPECFREYEDGKPRRYTLLFAVNGGAFAVAKLFSEAKNPEVLGELTLFWLSMGMIAFTILMVLDIYWFGQNMRCTLPRGAFGLHGNTVLIFERPGQMVLIFIGFLICAGWFLISL